MYMNKKNFWKKFLAVATCAVFCLGVLSGCGSEKDTGKKHKMMLLVAN